ncbi:hypothetical protein Tco_1031084 [Tanacetum coccineum]|uniref:DUF1985 domain-containing protein n=1 Tax=Tanacetum coccineum TaxID=301880 RepID=A0ABQ5G9Q4_9ASTR
MPQGDQGDRDDFTIFLTHPSIFDIDGRTLEYGREDFCLITGFRFGKVSLDPDEEDHSEFCMRVFLKIDNLKGEHLLELVNKDVKFVKLDDEDVGEYMWSFFHKRDYNVSVTRRKFYLEKLASNPKYEANYVLYDFVFPLKIWGLETFSNSIHWWRKDENVSPYGVAWGNGLKSSLDYFKKATHSIPVLRSATKSSSKGKSFHTRVWTEVRHEVHVRSEVSMMIIDLQLCLNSVEEKLKPGPSDVDHLDKSVEGVSQCTGLNDEYESVAVDGLISLWSQDVGHLSKVRELINDVFDTPSVQVQDACVSELLDVVKDDVNVNSVVKEEIVKDDVNVNSLVKEDIEKDDLHVDSFVKDAEQIENETLPRQKFPGKAYLSPYIQPA